MKDRNPSISNDAIDNAIDRVKVIRAIVRQACVDVLEGEVETMVLRNSFADVENKPLAVPISFISGVMHARDVLSSGISMTDYGIE